MGNKTNYATIMANKLLESANEGSLNNEFTLLHLKKCGILYGTEELEDFMSVMSKYGSNRLMDLFDILTKEISEKRKFYNECYSKGVSGSEMSNMRMDFMLTKKSLYVMASVVRNAVANELEKIDNKENDIAEQYKLGKVDKYTYEHKIAELDNNRALPSYYAISVEDKVMIDDAEEHLDSLKNRLYIEKSDQENIKEAEKSLKILKLESRIRTKKALFNLELTRYNVSVVQNNHKVLKDEVWQGIDNNFKSAMNRHQDSIEALQEELNQARNDEPIKSFFKKR